MIKQAWLLPIAALAACTLEAGPLGSEGGDGGIPEHTHDWSDITNTPASMPSGTIVMFAGSEAPDGWLLCDGSEVERATYTALYDAIGTTCGEGDGSTTFNVPDLRQRFPLGKAAAGTGSNLGETGGSLSIDESQLPPHAHPVDPPSATTTTDGAHTHQYGVHAGSNEGNNTAQGHPDNPTAILSTSSSGTHNHSVDIGPFSSGSTGSGNEFVPRYQVVNYLIKY